MRQFPTCRVLWVITLLAAAGCTPPLPRQAATTATTAPPPPTMAGDWFQVTTTPEQAPGRTTAPTQTWTTTAVRNTHTATSRPSSTSSATHAPSRTPSRTPTAMRTPTNTPIAESVYRQDDWSQPGSYAAAAAVDTRRPNKLQLGYTLPANTPYSDLNQDGYLDLILVNYFDGISQIGSYEINSYIYWGGAEGMTTGRRTELPTLGARSASVADLNADGYLDILFTNLHDNAKNYGVPAWIYWGGADGYSPARRSDLPTQGSGITSIADLNQDGWLDIVVGNHYQDDTHFVNYSWIYWGGADGYSEGNRTTLDTIGTYSNAVADFDKDGWLDIVFGNHRTTEKVYELDSYVYLGSAEGFSNERRISLPTKGATDSTPADLNGDGWLDLVFSNQRDNADNRAINSYVYWGGPGGLSPANRTELPTVRATANAAADLNGDGLLDLVFSNYRHPTSYIYWNSASGFSADNRTELPTVGAVGNAVEDLNGDGHLDIVFSSLLDDGNNFDTDSFIYWGGTGGYSVDRRQSLPTLGGYGIVCVGGTQGSASIAFGTTYARPNPEGQLTPAESIQIPRIYPEEGWLTSVPFGGLPHRWTALEWEVSLPGGTDAALEVSTSEDNLTWSDWRVVAAHSTNGANRVDLTLPVSAYLRYRVTLRGPADHRSTPALTSVTVRGVKEVVQVFVPVVVRSQPVILERACL